MSKIAELFAANVPRYTSYPTAPHFHEGVGERDYRNWLAGLSADTPLSLYIHIPFCDTLCWFCACHTSVVNNYTPVRTYLDLLLREIRLVAEALQRRHPVQHIHWGGGSPTILQVGDIERLNAAIRENFDVLPDAEFAVEIDPRGLGVESIKALARAGVTRASVGLQDRDVTVQRAINRIQTDEETIVALERLRGEGIDNLNLDLVYGLPYQTLPSWESTLDFAVWLNPDRLAVFGYAHVPQFKKHQALIPQDQLPDIENRFRMAELAHELVCGRGYRAVGLDHFAKPYDALAKAAQAGTLMRNFQGYTTDNAVALQGFGASAISALPQGYVQNKVDVPGYRKRIESGIIPIARGVELTVEDKLRRSVIGRVMCDLKVDLEKEAKLFNQDPSLFHNALERLAPLARDGVVEINGRYIMVSSDWRAAARLVAAAFDEYLPRGKSLHSASV